MENMFDVAEVESNIKLTEDFLRSSTTSTSRKRAASQPSRVRFSNDASMLTSASRPTVPKDDRCAVAENSTPPVGEGVAEFTVECLHSPGPCTPQILLP